MREALCITTETMGVPLPSKVSLESSAFPSEKVCVALTDVYDNLDLSFFY